MFTYTIRLFLALVILNMLVLAQTAAGPQKQPPTKVSQGTLRQPGLPAKKPVDGHLDRVETISAPTEMATTFYPRIGCDNRGNLYVRTDAGFVSAIHKLNAKGERLALFEVSSSPDLKVDVAADFALEPNGEDLYELVYPHEINRYVFIYKSDGSFKSAVKLRPGFAFNPTKLAVFPSGQFLIAGLEYDADKMAAMWPFTGIFAAEGSLLKELELEDDKTLRDMAAAGDTRVARRGNPWGNRAVSNGGLEMGADGNAYLMRWTNPAIFYAISAGGEVVRRFTVDPGDSAYWPIAMHLYKNRIAVLFAEMQSYDEIMKVVDLEGHEIATYDEAKANGKGKDVLSLTFACYTENPTRFVFLGANDDDKLQIWIAGPH